MAIIEACVIEFKNIFLENDVLITYPSHPTSINDMGDLFDQSNLFHISHFLLYIDNERPSMILLNINF